jgi:CheY-like chemotaxis protein
MNMLNIIHLDDHPLFCKAVRNCLTQHAMCKSYFSFHQSDQALQHIQNQLAAHHRIDVIITDFNHPGVDGFDFAREVRELEADDNKKHPILLLTMMALTHPIIQKGVRQRTFDRCFNKDISSVGPIEAAKQGVGITRRLISWPITCKYCELYHQSGANDISYV